MELILPEWPQYRLRRAHVAMALKLTRMRGPNAGYLRKLMAPFSLHGDALPVVSCLLVHRQRGCSRDYRYRVTPKVVSGVYLLKREWEYRSVGTKTDVYRLFLRYYCSHINRRSRNTWTRALNATGLFDFSALDIRFKDRKPNFLLTSQAPIGTLDECYDGRETEVSISCPKCPTDCSLKLSRERSIVQSWHKLDASSRLVMGAIRSWRTTRQGFEESSVRRMFEEAPESRTDDGTEEETPTMIG
ncbi:f-box domain containing protein [Colletotrichum musicola]|uniref:F-box domain containing protein n=1 Tax=Colletotrichum musicola TaxID=2175873 RepID=A0A8H6MQC2_9PEZI|nr:f-box domain containing protein [Colletotrichum musicola]